jgi:UDP-N-acetylmuramate: L-alanyl-gamma-D-glutamyl-meso-diaminopimelate ligase
VVKHKKLEMLDKETIQKAFKNPSLKVFDDSKALTDYLISKSLINSVLLLMSSGNFDGLQYQNLIPKN